jgi:predicted NBD/HSP70 family sugar kinase
VTSAQLASSETARRINRDIILEHIRLNQPISRAELSRRSGLQRSTVSQIIEQLIRENLVREGTQGSTARGRRPTLLGLNEDLIVIAVDLHPRQATVAAVDLSGRLLARSIAPLTSDPVASTRLITDCMLRIKHTMSKKSIAGIGVSLPGRVDPATQMLLFAPNLNWPGFDLLGALEKKMRLPVTMENAATACLLAELTFGRISGISDAVLVTVSEGVGTGLFAGGRMLSGLHGMAGEFGHVLLDPSGPTCSCGRKGCWETFASCRAAIRYYKELEPQGKAINFNELLNMAEEGDESAAKALEKQAHYIGSGCADALRPASTDHSYARRRCRATSRCGRARFPARSACRGFRTAGIRALLGTVGNVPRVCSNRGESRGSSFRLAPPGSPRGSARIPNKTNK